ncbi:MAG: hypothetical protein Q6373_005955 [Candidatus Sigynarchaeota archaeon]
MDEDDRLLVPSAIADRGDDSSGRPWAVKVFDQIKLALQTDKARYHLLKALVDGDWHDLTSLWRIAKRQRPIGLVGVGMALNALQASVGQVIFETGATKSNLDGDPVDSAWRVKDEYMGILRAVVTEMDGSISQEEHHSLLNNTLERVQLQKAARSQQDLPLQ